MKRTMLCALLLALVACGEPTGPDASPDAAFVPASTDLTLEVGEEQSVGGSVVKVTFVRVVEDSRCPMDVVCVWEGNAVVELGIRAGTGPTFPMQINTTLEPRATEWNGARVTILELQPYPKASEPTRSDAYTVKIRVEAVG
jgi:hypothetical protein